MKNVLPPFYGNSDFFFILICNILNFFKPKPTETVTTDESGVRLVNWPQWFYLYLSLFFYHVYIFHWFFCILHNSPTWKVYAVVCIHYQCTIELCYKQTQHDPINKLEKLGNACDVWGISKGPVFLACNFSFHIMLINMKRPYRYVFQILPFLPCIWCCFWKCCMPCSVFDLTSQWYPSELWRQR